MHSKVTRNPWAPMISFWCLLWQRQLELSLQHMARMGSAMPRKHAADLSKAADEAANLTRAPRAREVEARKRGGVRAQVALRSAQPAKTRSSATTT